MALSSTIIFSALEEGKKHGTPQAQGSCFRLVTLRSSIFVSHLNPTERKEFHFVSLLDFSALQVVLFHVGFSQHSNVNKTFS